VSGLSSFHGQGGEEVSGRARITLAAAPAILAALALARLAFAGDWHSGDKLVCSDCHTMHNSSSGAPMRYDNDTSPAPGLLRHATAISLCTYCHDGSRPEAPDVVAPVSYLPDPAGGSLASPFGQAHGTGHDLSQPSPVIPPGGATPMTLTCVSCHDPHGSPSYRNLRLDPLGVGANLPVAVTESILPDGSNPDKVYAASNLVYRAGMSAWCGACHGKFHGRTPSEEGAGSPWLRHPQDQTIAVSSHADYTSWSGAVANRVPVQSPNDTSIPSSDDQVFCLSCHKAHGSANRAGLIFADGTSQASTCAQCHNK